VDLKFIKKMKIILNIQIKMKRLENEIKLQKVIMVEQLIRSWRCVALSYDKVQPACSPVVELSSKSARQAVSPQFLLAALPNGSQAEQSLQPIGSESWHTWLCPI
jgi:hypothetical protein